MKLVCSSSPARLDLASTLFLPSPSLPKCPPGHSHLFLFVALWLLIYSNLHPLIRLSTLLLHQLLVSLVVHPFSELLKLLASDLPFGHLVFVLLYLSFYKCGLSPLRGLPLLNTADPWTTRGLEALIPCTIKNSTYNFWFPKFNY